MSSEHVIGQEASDEQDAGDHAAAVVDERPELEASVEQEIQGKVDTNHPDVGVTGLTLADEERLEAREEEIAKTRGRWDRRQSSDREARTRAAATAGSRERRERFQKRAASVDPWAGPDIEDPRAQLTQEELGAVNKQAARLADDLDGWSRAAISRRLAERVAAGCSMTGAVVGVHKEFQTAAGHVVPIGKLEDVRRSEVSIEGRIEELWEPSHASIAQVGLIADETGQTKLTIWKRSQKAWVKEGERVRIHGAALNWHNGRASVAVTGWSSIHFPERGRWWEE